MSIIRNAFAGWNMISSVGSYVSFAGHLVFFVCIAESMLRKREATANP